MAEHPAWNYWMHETLPDGRTISIYDAQHIDAGDVRNANFRLDARKWCTRYFWNAEQAAMISFGIDPDKVESADHFVPWDEEDEEYREHRELWTHMEKLSLLIKDAQDKEVLLKPFHPKMYVEWAEHVGCRVPDFVKKELEFVERERRGQVEHSKVFPGMYFDSDGTADDDSEQVSTKKGKGPQKRLDNNVTKILLAILVKSKLLETDVGKLSEDLAAILTDTKNKRRDKDFSLT